MRKLSHHCALGRVHLLQLGVQEALRTLEEFLRLGGQGRIKVLGVLRDTLRVLVLAVLLDGRVLQVPNRRANLVVCNIQCVSTDELACKELFRKHLQALHTSLVRILLIGWCCSEASNWVPNVRVVLGQEGGCCPIQGPIGVALLLDVESIRSRVVALRQVAQDRIALSQDDVSVLHDWHSAEGIERQLFRALVLTRHDVHLLHAAALVVQDEKHWRHHIAGDGHAVDDHFACSRGLPAARCTHGCEMLLHVVVARLWGLGT
mmetsp:Transcript_91458/g.232649  ORF Transcript_91458/g.232649 Transcript_91458/m.232649 type:complete len:262 (-) Transcript_91458:31-816(-)